VQEIDRVFEAGIFPPGLADLPDKSRKASEARNTGRTRDRFRGGRFFRPPPRVTRKQAV